MTPRRARCLDYDPPGSLRIRAYRLLGPVSRGLAAWHGKIYVAALDGRLLALDARTGKEIWTRRRPTSRASPPDHGRTPRGRRRGRDPVKRRAATSARAVTCRPTMRKPASRRGSSTSSRRSLEAGRRRIRLDHARWPRRHGPATGGRPAAAATTGTPSSTTRSSTWCTSGTGNRSPHPQAFCSPNDGDNERRGVDRRGECEDRQVRVALPGSCRARSGTTTALRR